MRYSRNVAGRLEYYSIPEPNSGCLLWCGPVNSSKTGKGYGNMSVEGVTRFVHQLAWITAKGAIPKGLKVLHRCDVRTCINIDHLFLGTQKQNIQDCADKGRLATLKGERSNFAKLTLEQVIAIRADPRTQVAIAVEYGVDQSAISNIKRRRNWAHVE